MTSENTKIFTNFMGIGYDLYQVRPKVLLIFDKRKILTDTWSKIIKWWPDDKISMRFVEKNSSFDYVLYGKSNILDTQWIFSKSLKTSEHYKKFKEECDGVAILGLALYVPTDESYDLEIFDYKKRVMDVRILNEQDSAQDDTILKYKETLSSSQNSDYFTEL